MAAEVDDVLDKLESEFRGWERSNAELTGVVRTIPSETARALAPMLAAELGKIVSRIEKNDSGGRFVEGFVTWQMFVTVVVAVVGLMSSFMWQQGTEQKEIRDELRSAIAAQQSQQTHLTERMIRLQRAYHSRTSDYAIVLTDHANHLNVLNSQMSALHPEARIPSGYTPARVPAVAVEIK